MHWRSRVLVHAATSTGLALTAQVLFGLRNVSGVPFGRAAGGPHGHTF